jgi:hypothetical protein
MAGPELLEGERLQRELRAHPLAYLRAYAPGLVLLGLAALLAAFFAEPAWGRALAGWLDAHAGPLAVPLLLGFWWLCLGGALAPFSLARRRPYPLAYGVAVAVAGGFAAVFLALPRPTALRDAGLLPWLTLAAVPVPLALAEARRRSESWTLTNLRLLRREGLWRPREEGWRLTRLERVELARRGPRALDYGDLVVARRGEPDLVLRGLRPLTALRDEFELLLHTAPEAPYLADQRETAERVQRLLRPGEGPSR